MTKHNTATNTPTIAPSDLIADEIRRRLQGASLSELAAMLRDSQHPPSAVVPAGTTENAPTVRALVRRVLGRGSMPSQDVVRAVQNLRPGTPAPTVRSDLSRMRVAGELAAVGPVRGGKLRVAR